MSDDKSKLTLEEVQETVMRHMRERHWDEVNTSRGLAISISLEASELLEYFQWNEESVGNKDDLASELADILIYAIHFADKNEIDILPAIMKKLEKSAKKYPVELFKTKDLVKRNKAWHEAKKNYKKDTTL